MKAKKRYLITHASAEIDSATVASELGTTTAGVAHAADFFAATAEESSEQVVVFSHIGISSAVLSEDEAHTLARKKDILAVEEDVPMHILGFASIESGEKEGVATVASLGSQPVTWNINMVNAPAAWKRGITGKGIKLAIIDTGICLKHPDIIPVAGGVSLVPGHTSYDDDNGHGTHCAGIAAARNNSIGVVGVAPEASLYAVKVLNSAGTGATSTVIAGMDWAAQNGMDVASMSLGAAADPSVAYATAVKRMQDKGIIVVIAAGNAYGSPYPWVGSPANSIMANTPNASPIAVGAIDQNKVIAPFSSRGSKPGIPWNQVSVVAPGVNIYSTWPPNTYKTLNGTSMATPHVAGAAALLKQRFPGILPGAAKTKLESTATPLGTAVAYGHGLINCDKATV